MKQVIRRGVFETNSSSTHSITMCSEEIFDKWINGEYLYVEDSWGWPEDRKAQIINDHFIPAAVLYPDGIPEDDSDEREEGVFTYGDFGDCYGERFETFEDSYNGVVAFGYYGFDG